MIWLLLFLVLLAMTLVPSAWVKHVLKKYSQPENRYANRGNGADLARHLLDQFDLSNVQVEETEIGDHYDPENKVVRLMPDNFNGSSLTSITIAAHEVGHAIQDARGETSFKIRGSLVKTARLAELMASSMLVVAPIILFLTKAPQASALVLLVGVASMAMVTVAHIATLPVEFDASFRKALPILDNGNYLLEGDLPHAQTILRAAALTYVAGSLASLLNLGRWIAILRR